MSKEYLKRFGEEDKRMADEAVRVGKSLPAAKSNGSGDRFASAHSTMMSSPVRRWPAFWQRQIVPEGSGQTYRTSRLSRFPVEPCVRCSSRRRDRVKAADKPPSPLLLMSFNRNCSDSADAAKLSSNFWGHQGAIRIPLLSFQFLRRPG